MKLTRKQIFSRAKKSSIIGEIELARQRNNRNWMQLLRIAINHAPEETRLVLRRINRNDNLISSLVELLARE